MSEPIARVVISLTEGRIEFEGPQDFVQAQLDRYDPLIQKSLSTAKPAPTPAPQAVKAAAAPAPVPAGSLAEYENVFAQADDKIQILKDLPGGSVAEKMVSAALLLSFANYLLGVEPTTFESIRKVCEAHGSLDGKNFSSTLKDEKDAFIFGGTKNKQTLKLTVPGRKRAEAMANSLNIA